MHIIVISASGFIFIYLLIYGIYLLATKEKRRLAERLRTVSNVIAKDLPSGEMREKAQVPSLKNLLGRAGGVFARRGMTKGLEEKLSRADVPLRGEEFLMIWMGTAVVPGTLLYAASHKMLLAMVVYMAGIILPPSILDSVRRRRLKKFDQQLSDSLSMMSNALRAGFSFMQCLEMVSKEMPNPIAKEFGRTFREMNLGTPTEQALQNLVKRVASDDLDLLVTAVQIQRQVGGNLAEVLDNISSTIRERIRIQGEIKTLTAQGRITGLIIALIPPALVLLLLLINPGYMRPLLMTKVGWALLATGITNEIIGALIIKKIISIDI